MRSWCSWWSICSSGDKGLEGGGQLLRRLWGFFPEEQELPKAVRPFAFGEVPVRDGLCDEGGPKIGSELTERFFLVEESPLSELPRGHGPLELSDGLA